MPRCFIDNGGFTDRKPVTPGYAASDDGTRRAQAIDKSHSVGGLSFITAVAEKTAAYTATATDATILCDATGGAFTITLPDVSDFSGYGFRIKKIDSSANAVTVATST